MRIIIKKIETIFDSVYYFDEINKAVNEEVLIIDFTYATFIRNHFISIIGMALTVIQNRGIYVKIIKPQNSKVLNSMKRIEFLSKFCEETNQDDRYKTMVRYTNIPLQNNSLVMQEFHAHFIQQFMGRVINLSPKLQKKILQKIFELFSNVFRHSNSALGLFCSGQFYPSQDKFNFTIVDNGVGIKRNVNRYLSEQFIVNRSVSDESLGEKFKLLNATETIEWALMDENSTTGEGGLGLNLLMELIRLSNGSIEIISSDGYYGVKDANKITKILNKSFDGTIISIELNTNSNNYYFLKDDSK